ncbi:MAG: KpsF/GutQ family sugar-phosphate isomerase [Gammaproteobacteria bacterium]|jgi:arabinose-5-phosphate isomerase
MPDQTEKEKLLQLGRAVVETETEAVTALLARINEDFYQACRHILDCGGRTVVTGMGKSGHVARKIAATLASTGTPAFFVHPGEAGHGDLGMITQKDVVMAVSNSGETDEILTLLPVIKRLNVPLIVLSGNPVSTLSRAASVHIDVGVAREACPLGLAPTASTTAALVMGDAIAIALLEARGFSKEDFALAHPGGSLGRRLLLRASDIMHTGAGIPRVQTGTSLVDALMEMTAKGLGTTAVVDGGNRLMGIYTDGDLRRTLDSGLDIHKVTIDDVMTENCKTINATALAAEALRMMEEYKINALLVVDEDNTLNGVLNMHDLLRARVV